MKRHFLKSIFLLFACILAATSFFSFASVINDEMESDNDYIHSIYSNFSKVSETDISGLDLSFLPDESMLLPANSSGASVKYYLSGAQEVSVQFYSSFGSLAWDDGGEYILGAESTADIVSGVVYKGDDNLFFMDSDGDIFISEANILYGEISFPYPYLGDSSDIIGLPILGAGLTASDGKTNTRLLPSVQSVSYIQDNINPDLEGVFYHTLKYIIPSGMSEIIVEINDIAGVSDALCLDEPYFTAISRIIFAGDKLAFKKNEVIEPSGESSTPGTLPPGESSLPPTGESSGGESSIVGPVTENSGVGGMNFSTGGYFSPELENSNKFTYDYGAKFGNAKRQPSGSVGNLGAKQSGTRVFSIITKVESSEAALIAGEEKELVTLADMDSLSDTRPESNYTVHLLILAAICGASILISFFVSFRSIKKEDKK